MKPDKAEVARVTEQAQEHLKKKYPQADMEIVDTLYDNMGNFSDFEYAANVINNEDQTEFLVFYNKDTKQTEDSYIADKWENELAKVIRPYLEDTFGELDDLWIFFDERIEYDLAVDYRNPNSYRDYDVTPSIMVFVPRESKSGDEELVNDFITFLKEEADLKHANVHVDYLKDGVPLDETSWYESF